MSVEAVQQEEGQCCDSAVSSLSSRVADVAQRVNAQLKNERRDHQSFRLISHSPIRALLPEGEVYRETVIPNASRSVIPEGETEPIQFSQFIRDSWESGEQRHLSISGKGGIGKTVALLTFATEQDFLDRRVPAIYVPLHRLAKRTGKKLKYTSIGKYIRRTFGKLLADEIEELARSPWNKGPNLILLLDGHNELPFEVTGDFADDIGQWARWPGVQVVMTSRNTDLPGVHMRQLRLRELTREDVKAYLQERKGIVPADSDPLWDVLTTPLMLKLYDDVSRFRSLEFVAQWLSFMEDSGSAGHLIWNYLQVELYECTRRTSSEVRQADYAVALLLVLPYACWRMERDNRFEIAPQQLRQYVRDGCAYWNESRRPSSVASVEELLLGDEYGEAPHQIAFATQLKILTTERALLYGKEVQKGIVYALVHQEFREALAAVHLRNAAEAAMATKRVPDEFDMVLDENVKNYFSDLAGADLLDGLWDQNRLRNLWNAGKPRKPAYRTATNNLLRAVSRQRGSLSTLSFSGMDLRGISLFAYRDPVDSRLTIIDAATKFEGTLVDVGCFSAQGHGDWVNSICFSPDGRFIASGSGDRTVRLWDARTREPVAQMRGHGGWVRSVCFSPDGRTIASGSDDCSVRLWDAHTHEQMEERICRSGILSVRFSPDGGIIASASFDGILRLWDASTLEAVAEVPGSFGIRSANFSPDGSTIASGSFNGTLCLWDVRTLKKMVEISTGNSALYATSFSPDGRLVASGSEDGALRLWDARTLDAVAEIPSKEGVGVRTIRFSPDGSLVAAGSTDGRLHLWDTQTMTEAAEPHEHGCWINTACFSPDGRVIASGSTDGSIRLWDISKPEPTAEIRGHGGWVSSVRYSPDGRLIASGSGDGSVRLWDVCTRVAVANMGGHSGWVYSVCFSPDGRFIASGSGDGSVRLWDARTHRLVADMPGHGGWVRSVDFSPDGKLIASGSTGQYVQLWDAHTHELVDELPCSSTVRSVCFSPDGRLLAYGSSDGFVRLWDGHVNLQPGGRSPKHRSEVRSVCFSPDGNLLVSGYGDGFVRLWDVSSLELLAEIREDKSAVRSVCFSQDSRLIVAGFDNGFVRLWDAHTHSLTSEIRGHGERTRSVCLAPDGRVGASGSDDGIRLWDVETGAEIESIRPIYGIDLIGLDLSLAVMEDEDRKTLLQNGALVPPPGSAERARRVAEEAAGASAASANEQKGTPSMPAIPDFKIGFTFRGTYRDSVVGPACEELLRMGYARRDVFYYPWHQPLVGGVGSAETLRGIYHDHCACVVVLLSPDYAEGNWTGNVEWRAVLDLVNGGGANKICLLSAGGVDVGSIPGLYATSDIAIDVDGMSPAEVAQTIVDWIRYHSS